MIIYQDPYVIVENRMFRGWLVTEVSTGRQQKPSREQADQIAVAWHHIRTNFKKVPEWRTPAEQILMRLFADACLHPTSPAAEKFLSAKAVTIAAEIVDAVILRKH